MNNHLSMPVKLTFLLLCCLSGCAPKSPERPIASAHSPVQISLPVKSEPPVQSATYDPWQNGMYVPFRPDRLPSEMPGQRFLCLPAWDEDLPYLDEHNQTVSFDRLALKTFTLKRIDRSGRWPMLYFVVEGWRGQVHIENGGPLSALPGLRPVVEDTTVRRLRAKYEGRQVWGYGGIDGQFVTTNELENAAVTRRNDLLCRLVHIVRIYGIKTLLAMGSVVTGFGPESGAYMVKTSQVSNGDRQSGFVTNSPLVVVLVPQFHSAWRNFYAEFADAWDFERSYSLISPRQAGTHWPAAMKKAILSDHLKKGMTPEMVAWTMGYPALYGTAAQMKSLDEWEYDYFGPWHFHVHFENGKVTDFGPDGHLP